MYRLWHAVIEPVISALDASTVVAFGAGDEPLEGRLIEAAGDRPFDVHVVDERPGLPDPVSTGAGGLATIHRGPLLTAASAIRGVDVALVDGDPNWHTVFHVLQALEDRAGGDGRVPPVALVHNVRWPFGRRDGYRDPERIPPAHRHPSARIGVTPGRRELSETGLDTGLFNALTDHGPRNGVRTAIDDFVEASGDQWTIVDLPGLGGLAVLASQATVDAHSRLAGLMSQFRDPAFLEDHCRRLESANILVAIDLQRARSLVPEGSAPAPSAQPPSGDALDQAAAELPAVTVLAGARAESLTMAAPGDGEVPLRLADTTGAVAEARLDALREAAAAMERELRASRTALEERLVRSEQERSQLQMALTRREQELDRLGVEHVALQRQLDADAARLKAADVSAEQLRALLARAETTNDRDRLALTESDRRCAALERELEARGNEMAAARDQELLLADRVGQLDRELQRTTERVHAAELEREDVRVKLIRTRDTRSWRWVRRAARIFRRMSFRSADAPSALDLALEQLETPLTTSQVSPRTSEIRPELPVRASAASHSRVSQG